jgi:ATP-dependent Clp endopeptidase proteolytic subunit ClpP
MIYDFLYTVNPLSDEPVMLLNKQIGSDADGIGIQGDLFQAELLALDEMKPKRIQIYINSIGGVVDDGFNIFNAILKSKTPVDTYCVGMAASVAGVIFQAGRKRIMADYGILMYHNPSGGDDKSLQFYKQSLMKMLVAKTGKTEDEWIKICNRETFYDAEEAKSVGLCDEIEPSEDFNKKHWKQISNSGDSILVWKEANKIINKIFETKPQTMKKVCNKLGLVEDAKEENVLAAIDKLEDRAVRAETAVVSAKADLEVLNKSKASLEEEMKKHKDAFEKCKAELDKMQKEKDEVENAAKKEKATAMVKEAAQVGRIKNEDPVINKWVDLAVKDFDGTKAMYRGTAT